MVIISVRTMLTGQIFRLTKVLTTAFPDITVVNNHVNIG